MTRTARLAVSELVVIDAAKVSIGAGGVSVSAAQSEP